MAGAPAPAAPPARRKPGRGRKVGGALLEGLFEALFATELGLLAFGGVALAVGIPLLVVFGGAAWAARVRRKREPAAPPIGLGALLTPAVLLAVLVVLLLFGALSLAAFEAGHPVLMACSSAAALATLGSVGFMAMQRRAERR